MPSRETKITLPAVIKPLLRGYLHAGAGVAAIIGTGVLLYLTRGNLPGQLSLLIYGLSSVILFGCSALYHIGSWSPPRNAFLRRLDHANIFLLIAGTYTPIAFNVLSGGWRIGILVAVWGLGLIGMLTIAPALHLPRYVTTALYVLIGWVALAAIPPIVASVGLSGMLLLALGGILYTLGAVIYALRWPTLWPRVFGYHEAFHLATIVAACAFFAFMVIYVVPSIHR